MRLYIFHNKKKIGFKGTVVFNGKSFEITYNVLLTSVILQKIVIHTYIIRFYKSIRFEIKKVRVLSFLSAWIPIRKFRLNFKMQWKPNFHLMPLKAIHRFNFKFCIIYVQPPILSESEEFKLRIDSTLSGLPVIYCK